MSDPTSTDRFEPSPVHGAGDPSAEQPFAGVRRRTSHTEKATVTAYAFDPGAIFPIHSHREEQITVVLDGTVEFDVDGEAHSLGAGETFVVPADLEHGLQAGPDGARFLAILVPRRADPDAYEIKGDQRK
jgi:quercetin dioxygenase-like cupin family protein